MNWWSRNFGSGEDAPPTEGGKMSDQPGTQSVRDLDVKQLRLVIIDGVYWGVLKAVGVYLLLSALIAFLIAIINESTRYG